MCGDEIYCSGASNYYKTDTIYEIDMLRVLRSITFWSKHLATLFEEPVWNLKLFVIFWWKSQCNAFILTILMMIAIITITLLSIPKAFLLIIIPIDSLQSQKDLFTWISETFRIKTIKSLTTHLKDMPMTNLHSAHIIIIIIVMVYEVPGGLEQEIHSHLSF